MSRFATFLTDSSNRCGASRDTAELWAFVSAYAVFSSTLLVANKWALSWIPAGNFLMALQCLATVAAVYVISCVAQKRLLVNLQNPLSTRSSTLWFIACVLVQYATIFSNMQSLHLLGVDRVILLRIFAMFPIAIGDWIFKNRHLPSFNAWTCFCCLGAAVGFVFGFDKTSLTASGIAWGLGYFASITADQVLLKRFTKAIQMEDGNRTLWMNLLAAPVSIIALFAFGEHATISATTSNPKLIISIAVSCILGAGISYTAWGLRRRSSAVTFSLVGVVCKLGSIALNFLFFEHLSWESLLIISLGIVSTFFYEQAPERQSSPRDFSPLPKRDSGDAAELDDLTGNVDLEDTDARTSPKDSSKSQPNVQDKWKLNFSRKSFFVLAIFICIIVAGVVRIAKVRIDGASDPTNDLPHRDDYNTTAPLPEHPVWSSHRCVGETWGATPWKYRSCAFKNVCYDGNPNGTLTYFAHRYEAIAAHQLSTPSMVPFGEDPRAIPEEYKVNLVRGAINASNVIWAHGRNNASVVTIITNFFLPEVWTHLVFDNFFPMFRLLEMFGMPEAIVEPLWFDFPCKFGRADGCNFGDPRVDPSWYNIITAGVFTLSKIQDRYSKLAIDQGTMVCFENVMSGLSLLSDHGLGASGHGRDLSKPDWPLWGTIDTFWRYRLRTMERMGLSNPLSIRPARNDGFYDVVFLRKGSKVANANAIDPSIAVSNLKATLQAVGMSHIRIAPEVCLEKFNITTQMNLISRAKVVVSQVGSTAYGAFWLPRDATLVLLEQGELLDFYFWHQLGHLSAEFVRWDPQNTEPITRSVLSGLIRYDSLQN